MSPTGTHHHHRARYQWLGARSPAADPAGVAQPHRDGRLRRPAARRGLGHARRHRRAAAPVGRRAGVRSRSWRHRVRAGHAARVRRRSHRRHRQHHAQAHGRRQAPAVGGFLVLPRALVRGVRPGAAALARGARAGRPGRGRRLQPAADHRPHRDGGLRRLPAAHRRGEPRGAARDRARVPPDAHRRLRRGRARAPPQQPRPDQPHPARRHQGGAQGLAHVPRRACCSASASTPPPR